MPETSLGTAALAALYACAPTLDWGCELFGPLRLEDDIVLQPSHPREGLLHLPNGVGLGVTLDEDRIAFLTARSEFARQVHSNQRPYQAERLNGSTSH
jgi:muconate cycloisomerase